MTCLETQSKKEPFFLPGSLIQKHFLSTTGQSFFLKSANQSEPALPPPPSLSVASAGHPTKDSLVFAAFTLATSFCTQVTSPFLTARIRSCSRPILTTGPGSGLQSPGRGKEPAQSSVSSPCLNVLEDYWSWGNKSGVSGNGLLVRQRYSPSRCSGSCHRRQESRSLVGWRLCRNLA